MEKYFFYLRKGLRWSIPFYVGYFVLTYFRNGDFESVYAYFLGFFLFVFLAGPLWSYCVIKINNKKKKKPSSEDE